MRKIIIDKDVKIQGILNRFPLSSLVSEVDGQEVVIRDVETEEKELSERFDEIVNKEGEVYGSTPEEVVQVLNVLFKTANIESFTVEGNSEIQTSLKTIEFLSGWVEFESSGGEIVPSGVADPTNVSTGENNLINGNTTDLVYNNSSAGSSNKELPAVDLGAQKLVQNILVWFWNNTYTSSNYKIQGSNDLNEWIDIQTGLNSTGIVGTNQNPQNIQIDASFRYFRLFCVQGNNATWCVISEMKLFESGAVQKKNIFDYSNIELIENEGEGELKIVNKGTVPVLVNLVKR